MQDADWKLLYSGGLEMLFSDQRTHEIEVPATHEGKPSTVGFLIDHLCDHLMTDTRKDFFVVDGNLYVGSVPAPEDVGSLLLTEKKKRQTLHERRKPLTPEAAPESSSSSTTQTGN